LKKIDNILVIRLSSMGDVILTTSFIRQLRNKFTDTRIDFITSKSFAEIYKFNPNINTLWEYDKQFKLNEIAELKNHIKMDLKGRRYDYVIDLQKNLRSKILRSGLGDKYLLINKLRLNKLSLVYFKKPILKKIIPIPELYRLTANPLLVDDDGEGLEIWLKSDPKYYFTPKNSDSKKMKIAVAPGAYHFTKRWQKEKYLELIKNLKNNFNAEIILIGGLQDKEVTDWLKSQIDFEYEDFSDSTSILKTTEAIDNSDLLISNDTGVIHIAAARKVPVLAIFGSTVKEFGFLPFRTKYKIVEKGVSCRPCTHYGLDKCPRGHFDCMSKITVDDVLKAFSNFVETELEF